MRRKILAGVSLLILVGALLLPVEALAFRVPTVTQRIAHQETERLLRRFPGWRFREVGYIACRGGRIGRTAWSCRVAWVYHRGCHLGRAQVRGVAVRGGRKYYTGHYRGLRGCRL